MARENNIIIRETKTTYSKTKSNNFNLGFFKNVITQKLNF